MAKKMRLESSKYADVTRRCRSTKPYHDFLPIDVGPGALRSVARSGRFHGDEQERRWLRQLGLPQPRGLSAKTWNTPCRSERCYSGPSWGSVVQSNLPLETIPVSERRTHSQRPRTVGPCSPRQHPRKCTGGPILTWTNPLSSNRRRQP